MARPGVTKEQVRDAVAALRAQGRPTSTRVVRLELRRGSYATIGKYLEELGAKSGSRPPELPEIPEDVQMRLAEGVYSMWLAMSKVAAAKAADLGIQCEQRVRTMTEQLNRERATRQRLERELSTAVSDRAGFKGRSETLELEKAGLRERLAVQQALVRQGEREREGLLRRLTPSDVLQVPLRSAQRTKRIATGQKQDRSTARLMTGR